MTTNTSTTPALDLSAAHFDLNLLARRLSTLTDVERAEVQRLLARLRELTDRGGVRIAAALERARNAEHEFFVCWYNEAKLVRGQGFRDWGQALTERVRRLNEGQNAWVSSRDAFYTHPELHPDEL